MMDELAREVARMQAYAAELGALIADAQATAPASAEGSDPSGAVRAQVGPDGIPVWIRVGDGWRRRLGPAALGGAVEQACAAAAGERMSGWAEALAGGSWKARMEWLDAVPDGRPGPGPGPFPGTRQDEALTPRPHPRPLDVLAEDMIKAFDDIAGNASSAPRRAASGTGTAGGGALEIRLAETGMVSCAAEPGWVSGQSPADLNHALSQALAGARQELAAAAKAARAQRDSRTAHLDGLLSEALSLLKDPRLLAGPQTGPLS